MNLKPRVIKIILNLKWIYSKLVIEKQNCHAPNPTIKIGTWQSPHAYKVSTLQACKAFLATKIYPQKFRQ